MTFSGKALAARLWRAALRCAVAAILLAAAVAPVWAVQGPLADAAHLFDAGKYQRAAEVLRVAAGKDASDAKIYYWLGRNYFELRDIEHAVTSLERAVQLDAANAEYHDWLGRACGRKAEQAGVFSSLLLAKRSRREFEEAVRLDPSNFHAQHDLIEFYYRAPGIAGGGEDKAQKQIEALAALDAVEGHLARADFYMDKKKPELAEQEARQAWEVKPRRIQPYFDIADFYLKRSDAVHAEQAVEAAAQIDSADRRLSYYRGAVRVLAGNRLNEAEQLLRTYLVNVPQRSDLPSHAGALEWLGRFYEKEGRRATAAEQYRAALAIDPHSKSARDALRRISK